LLKNKAILIISPQSWDKMMLAKHHYALELAKAGNRVFFLNPPDNINWSMKRAGKRIRVRASGVNPGLMLIDQQLYFPFSLKFHARPVYNFFIKKHILDILKVIGTPIDIVWSFDIGNLFPIKYFPDNIYKIFHPVDEPADPDAFEAATGAAALFSVTQEILNKYQRYHIPSYFINHGVADEFLSIQPVPYLNGGKIHVGMSGNLLRRDIDRKVLIRILEENPDLVFHFYGTYLINDPNFGGHDPETGLFIEKLKGYGHVILHGVLKTADLARELNSMDIFLICYDIEKDQSKGTNYHKVMEYLSTGKAIVSNNITTYKDLPALVRMPLERSSNNSLPALFKETVQNLEEYNKQEFACQRKSFARKNSYATQLSEISQIIAGTVQEVPVG
jgi:hypothetical protein